ncbi:unnamed protein product [Ascophyllum nodosum]
MADWFTSQQPGQPPSSFMQGICRRIIPVTCILLNQPLVIFGLFGLPSSWLDVLSMDLNIDGLISQRTIKSYVSIFATFLAFVRPTLPVRCPSWLHKIFPLVAWSLYGDDATRFSGEGGGANGSSETFVYVNGICTTKQMAKNTCKELSAMFQRDVIGVHNPTDSMIIDLLECILGKLWIGESVCVSEPVKLVYEEVKKVLQDPKKTKVVLISHSQGTIIAGDVLWKLWSDVDNDNLPQTAMNRLEIYAVANASQYMEQRGGFPYIESICNNYDNVGMLGANAPARTKDTWDIRIAGKVIFPTKPKWGHMISSHYLQFLRQGDYPDSKLHHYMN